MRAQQPHPVFQGSFPEGLPLSQTQVTAPSIGHRSVYPSTSLSAKKQGHMWLCSSRNLNTPLQPPLTEGLRDPAFLAREILWAPPQSTQGMGPCRAPTWKTMRSSIPRCRLPWWLSSKKKKKKPPAMPEPRFDPWVGKICW